MRVPVATCRHAEAASGSTIGISHWPGAIGFSWTTGPGSTLPAVGNAMHAISIHDVASDTVHQFAPTYRDYVLYSDNQDGEDEVRFACTCLQKPAPSDAVLSVDDVDADLSMATGGRLKAKASPLGRMARAKRRLSGPRPLWQSARCVTEKMICWRGRCSQCLSVSDRRLCRLQCRDTMCPMLYGQMQGEQPKASLLDNMEVSCCEK